METTIITKNRIRQLLPGRPRDAHKGDFGKVFIAAGSPGMAGAAVLSARSALRSGSGQVIVSIDEALFPVIHAGAVCATCVPRALATGTLDMYDAFAVGPGLGQDAAATEAVDFMLRHAHGILVLDADALNIIAREKWIPAERREPNAHANSNGRTNPLAPVGQADAPISAGTSPNCAPQITCIMTPHEGEAARLLGTDAGTVRANRTAAARALAQRFRAIVVLKGAATLVAIPQNPSGNPPAEVLFENPTGNPGMATAGSGDVLTGMIVSFAGQSMSAADATLAGVYLHGLAGDLANREKGAHGMIATDIIENIPYAIKQLSV